MVLTVFRATATCFMRLLISQSPAQPPTLLIANMTK
jgi:hypothetical protein